MTSLLTSPWIVGFTISVLLGALIVPGIKALLGLGVPLPTKEQIGKGIPGWITGMVERFFFMIVVADSQTGLGDASVAMMVWLTLKLGANWGRQDMTFMSDDDTRRKFVNGGFVALLSGLVSMLFAIAGGFAVRCGVRLCFP